jgi:hypothetical protein
MPATMTTVDSITKEVYQGRIRNQLQEEAVGYKRIESSSEGIESQVGGKYVTFPIRVRRNQGIGYRNELEQLQAGGQQGYASVRVPLSYGYGRTRLSGQVIELAKTNYQAFANAMELEMDGLKNDLAKDTNRIFYGDGNGTLATVTADAANSVTVASTQYLEVGQQIDIVTTAGVVHAANRQITAINKSTGVVTYDGADAAASTAAGDIIVRTGNFNREPNGLLSIVTSTGALFNVDPANEPSWAAIVDANGGVNRALSEGLMINNVDAVRVNGGKTSLLLTGLGVRRAYFNLLSQQRRYPSTTEFEGGFRGLAFSAGREIPVIEDPDAPPNTMYGLDESTLKIYRDEPWSWMDRDGSVWKWVHDYDAYEAIIHQYWELGVNRRNANFVIKDLTEG